MRELADVALCRSMVLLWRARLRIQPVADEVASVGRGLMGTMAGTVSILRRSGVTLAFTSIAAALACSLGPLGAAGAILVLGIGAAATVERRSELDVGRLLRAGTSMLVLALPCVGAVLAGAHLAHQHGAPHFLSGWALFFGLTFLGTFVLLPLMEAAPRLVAGSGGMGAALAAALEASGRRGFVRTVLAALGASGAVVIVPVIDALGPVRIIHSELGSPQIVTVLTLATAGGAVTWLALTSLGGALAAEAPRQRTRARSAFAFIGTGIALLVAGTLVLATLVPAPPAAADPLLLAGETAMDPALEARIEHPSPHATMLVVRHHGFPTVALPVPYETPPPRAVRMPEGATAVLIETAVEDSRLGAVMVGPDGARLDDGPLDRIAAHVGFGAAGALSLAAGCVLLALASTHRRRRLHRAVRRGAESVVVGRLRADAGELSIASGRTEIAGATFEASDGSCVFALPAGLAVLGAELPRALTDGQTLELVSPVAMPTLSFRDGIAACPADAALVVPGQGRIDWLVGTWALAPAGGLLAAASLAAVAGTMLTLGGEAWIAELGTGAPMRAVTAAFAPPPATDLHEARTARMARIAHYVPDGSMFVEGDVTVIGEARRTRLLAELDPASIDLGPDMELWGIEQGSALDLLGLENGDVLVRVAGVPVSRPADLDGLRPALATLSGLGVTVIRRGAEIDVRVIVR